MCIRDRYNTGTDDFNQPLTDGETDSHYQLVISADVNYPGPESKVIFSNEFPIGNWYPNGDKSKWIAPRTDAGKWNEAGTYAVSYTHLDVYKRQRKYC